MISLDSLDADPQNRPRTPVNAPHTTLHSTRTPLEIPQQPLNACIRVSRSKSGHNWEETWPFPIAVDQEKEYLENRIKYLEKVLQGGPVAKPWGGKDLATMVRASPDGLDDELVPTAKENETKKPLKNGRKDSLTVNYADLLDVSDCESCCSCSSAYMDNPDCPECQKMMKNEKPEKRNLDKSSSVDQAKLQMLRVPVVEGSPSSGNKGPILKGQSLDPRIFNKSPEGRLSPILSESEKMTPDCPSPRTMTSDSRSNSRVSTQTPDTERRASGGSGRRCSMVPSPQSLDSNSSQTRRDRRPSRVPSDPEEVMPESIIGRKKSLDGEKKSSGKKLTIRTPDARSPVASEKTPSSPMEPSPFQRMSLTRQWRSEGGRSPSPTNSDAAASHTSSGASPAPPGSANHPSFIPSNEYSERSTGRGERGSHGGSRRGQFARSLSNADAPPGEKGGQYLLFLFT